MIFYCIDSSVAVTPAVTATLVKKGFKVNVEAGAGMEAKFRDSEYVASGANIVDKTQAFQSGQCFKFQKNLLAVC